MEYVSRWQDRFPADFERRLEALPSLPLLRGWQRFTWDNWSDVLRMLDIETEALFQLNRALLCAIKLGFVETRNQGTEYKLH
jgi:hypothetical protein